MRLNQSALCQRIARFVVSLIDSLTAEATSSFKSQSRNTDLNQKQVLPLVLAFALGFWGGCALLYWRGYFVEPSDIPILASILLAVSVAIGILAGAYCARLRRLFPNNTLSLDCLLAALVGFAIGCLLGAASAYALHLDAMNLEKRAGSEAVILVESDANDAQRGYSCYAKVVFPDSRSLRAKVYLEEEQPRYGERLSGRVSSVSFSDTEVDWLHGACGRISFEPDANHAAQPGNPIVTFRIAALETLENSCGASAPLLKALLCGYRCDIMQNGTYDTFRIGGLAHLVAVSGAHLALSVGALACVMREIGVSRRFSYGSRLFFCVAYVVFAGMPLSAIRAAVMSLIASGSFVSRRRASSLNALGLCIAAMVLADPASSVSVSFYLSCGATLGIIVLGGYASLWVAVLVQRVPRCIVDPVSLTLSSSVLTLPVSASLFSQLSLIALVANIVATPLFTLACVVGLCGLVLSLALNAMHLTDAASLMLLPASVCERMLAHAVEIFSKVPYASIPATLPFGLALGLSAGCFALLWHFWPRPSRKIALSLAGLLAMALSLFLLFVPYAHGTRLVMLDVGQGDAFVLESDGQAILIDTGADSKKLARGLAEAGVYALDAVAISHPDADHCAALQSLRGLVRVDRVFVARDLLECGCENCSELRLEAEQLVGSEDLVGLAYGDCLTLGSMRLRVVWPKAFSDEGGNADSLAFLVEVDEGGVRPASMLLVGDLEDEQLDELIASERLDNIDILKVGHHGSRASIDCESADTLKPRIALVSVGDKNRYGHPTREVLDALEKAGALILRTDEQGSVMCVFEDGSILVKAKDASKD